MNFELWDGWDKQDGWDKWDKQDGERIINCELGTSCKLAQRNPPPRSTSPKERGAVRSSAVWGCKENFELGTNCRLGPAGEMPDGKIVHINTVDKGNYNGSGMTEPEYINAQRIQKDAPNSKVITIGKGDVPGDLTIEKPKDGCDN